MSRMRCREMINEDAVPSLTEIAIKVLPFCAVAVSSTGFRLCQSKRLMWLFFLGPHNDCGCYVTFCSGLRRICGTTGSNRSRFKILFVPELFSHTSCETPHGRFVTEFGQSIDRNRGYLLFFFGATYLWKSKLVNGIFVFLSC